jgi:hypothetical protein
MKHPVALLAETEGLTGYEFQGWLMERSDEELKSLSEMAYSLNKLVSDEEKNRGLTK